jgi:hypothetical protein
LSRAQSNLLGTIVGCCLGLGAPAVGAEPKLFVTLDYRADSALDGCPDESAFRAMVQSQLGYDPFRSQADNQVSARIAVDAGRMHGIVEWRDESGTPRGERALPSEAGGACLELARTMSFAVAVQIQLLARDAESKASSSGVAPSEPERGGAEATQRPSEPERARDVQARPVADGENAAPPPWEILVGIGPMLSFGVAPRTAVEGRAFASVRRGRMGLELGAETGFWSSHRTSGDEGFEQHLVRGSATACFALPPLSGCFVSKVGRLTVRGFGVDEPRSSSGVVALLGPRFALEQELGGRFLAALRVEVLATLVPWRVELNDRQIWKAPPAAVFVGADVARFFQ